MEMPAIERVLLAFQHQEADRVPIFSEARNVGFIEQMTGKRLSGSREEMEIISAAAYARAGIDLIRRLLTPYWGVVPGDEYDVRWDGYLNWKVGGERVYTYPEAIEQLKVRWCADGAFDASGAARAIIDEVGRLQAILGESILFMPMVNASPLEGMYHSVGIENFSFMMYEHPGLIDEALERNTGRAIQTAMAINEIYDGPIIHCCDDLGMKGRTIFAPAWLRAHLFPRIRRVAEAIHAGGKYFSFHSCGNVTSVIPDLIEAGIDALNPIEVTSGMDLAEVKRLYGDALVIMGNASANIVQMGTPEQVRQEVRRCLDDAAAGGGYFLDGGRTPATPPENLVAYFDEAKSYQGWRAA